MHADRPDTSRPDGDEPDTTTLTSDSDGAVVEMVVSGRWDWRLFLDLRTTVHKCLAEHPTALIVDLHALDDPSASSVPLWLAASRTGETMNPPVQLGLSVPPETPLGLRLKQMSHGRPSPPVFATVAAARTALGSGPTAPDRVQLHLPAAPTSASRARGLVADACRAWAIPPQLLHDAQFLISELVRNAVEHAGTDMLVTVERRDTLLRLAVRDGSPTLPRPLNAVPVAAGAPLDDNVLGLRLVDEIATAWGARPTHDGGGKVVWAILRAPRSPSG